MTRVPMHMSFSSDRPSSPTVTPARVVIVHGYGADGEAHWFPWLARELSARGIDVVVADLPSPDSPDAAEWTAAARQAIGVPDGATWIVAHSLGGITALRALLSTPATWSLGGIVLVAGFTGPLASLPILDAFLSEDITPDTLTPRIAARHVIRSDHDPYVPISACDQLAQRLRAQTHVVAGAGHFLAEDWLTDLPIVLDILLEEN